MLYSKQEENQCFILPIAATEHVNYVLTEIWQLLEALIVLIVNFYNTNLANLLI